MDIVTTCIDKLIALCQEIAIAKCPTYSSSENRGGENDPHLTEAQVLNNIDDGYEELKQTQEYIELERKMKQFILEKTIIKVVGEHVVNKIIDSDDDEVTSTTP